MVSRRRESPRASVVVVVAEDTGRILLGLRSLHVSYRPGTWAAFGGSAEPGETSEETALRELREETGYAGEIEMVQLTRYRGTGGVETTTFLGTVPHEFPPILNWEHDDARWTDSP